MPKPENPEQLQARAAELSRQAAEARAALQAQAKREAERERERLAKADRGLLESYDRRALDRDVEEARQRFEEAVAQSPVTKALADYICAGFRRNWGVADAKGAHARLGLPGVGPRDTEQLFVPSMNDAVAQAATRMAQAQIDTERADKEQS